MRAILWRALLFLPLVYSAQEPIKATTTTLVDLLSADAEYTTLLRLLQRTRLIPTLNKLNGSTFFAPTNDAIARYVLWNNIPLFDEGQATDNINEQLRQRLLYHLLNYTLPQFPPTDGVEIYKTLHFPRIALEPPSDDPPPAPPWLPLPGGSLNNEPQRLRAAVRNSRSYVDVDAFGRRGVSVVKDAIKGSNCMLVGIGDVIDVPPDLATIVRTDPRLSYLTKILPESQMQVLQSSPGLTLFLPEDNAWSDLHPVVRLYLEGPFAHADLRWMLGMHVAGGGEIGWTDTFGNETEIRTLEGNRLLIQANSSGILVSGAQMHQQDVYAANGVLHTVSSLLLPPGSLQLNAEKYLLALNCSSFVGLLRSVNLTDLVTNPEAKYTILAPRDDVLEVLGGESFPDPGTEELKRSLQYHFIPGKWTPQKLQDGLLLETELVEIGLGGARQVLDVGVSDKKGDKKEKPRKELYFAGAGVIGDAIEIDNTLIYLVSRPISPPADVLETALSSVSLSTYIAAVFTTSLANTVKNLPRTTFLIPTNSAWERLGLVTSYLLMTTSKRDLESVVLHHTLDSIQYLHLLRNGTERTFRTIEGTDVTIRRQSKENGGIDLIITGSGGWDGLEAKIDQSNSVNTLTETGVLHEIDDLLIPRSVQITLGKLVRAAGGGTMASLVSRAGMEWILNGTAPPDDSEWAKLGKGVGWTLLVPRDDAWRHVNLTRLWEDPVAIKELVTQHLIPTLPSAPDKGKHGGKKKPKSSDVRTAMELDESNMPLDMSGTNLLTARSSFSRYGDISFLDKGDHFVVGISGARGTKAEEDWAKVISWGRSTVSTAASGEYGARGGVIQIDRVLEPYTPRWWVMYGPPVAAGLGGILVVGGMGYVFWKIYKRRESEPTYEPVGRDEDEDG